MRSRLVRLALAIAVLGALGAGAVAVAPEVEAGSGGGGCHCPLIYAPVVCDHGKTYPNQCEADCHNARNCVPAGLP